MDELPNETLNEITTSQNLTSKVIQQLEEQASDGNPTCIILARKNSKRLKHKNRLVLNGKPLVQYAIDTAKESSLFGNIIVSSDDINILEMAYESGVLVHQRPEGLCGDKIQMKNVVRFLAEVYTLGNCTCLLTPCNPFITPEDLKLGYQIFKDKQANYVMSVKVARPHPMLARRLVKGMIEPVAGLQRSQKYEPMYFADGGFIFFKPDAFFKEYDMGFYGTKNYPYITPHFTIDIDTQEDFDLASKIMEKKWN